MIRRSFRLLMALGVLALATGRARADFNFQVFSDNALTTQLYSQNGNVPVDLAALNGAVASRGLQFSSLLVTSNAGSQPANGYASLTLDGVASRLQSAPAIAELFILTVANNYTAPAGPVFPLVSSASHSFTNVGAGTSPYFQGIFNNSNQLDARGVGTAFLVFGPPQGNSTQTLTSPVVSALGEVPYTLATVTRIRLVGSAGATDAFSGITSIGLAPAAVPEPASMAMLAVGGLGIIGAARRRKAKLA